MENDMGGGHLACMGEKRRFGGKAWRQEATWKTLRQIMRESIQMNLKEQDPRA